MKKIISILCLSIFFLSCDKTKKDPIKLTNDTLCDVYNSIDQNNYLGRYLFLVTVKSKYCSGEMNDCILKNHDIDDTEYNNRVKLVNAKSYSIPFSEIDKLISNENDCLYKYIGFKINEKNEITGLELVNFSLTQKRRYSIPLFNSLKSKFNIVGTDIIVFDSAKKTATSDLDVMFRINRNNVRVGASYDVTIDPSFNIDFRYFGKFFENYPNPYQFSD